MFFRELREPELGIARGVIDARRDIRSVEYGSFDVNDKETGKSV